MRFSNLDLSEIRDFSVVEPKNLNNFILFKLNNIKISFRDMKTLSGDSWLNDNVSLINNCLFLPLIIVFD
jgi:hypothetical protein